MRLFIFGLGFSARAFVKEIAPRCAWIGATTRSPEKAAAMRGEGIEPYLFGGDGAGQGIADALRDATHILISIAPNADGDPVLTHHGDDIAAAKPNWIGYLSTVGVYGNHDGHWVDEDTLVKPVSQRSRQRVAAEDAWLAFGEDHALPIQIFRLSGIYGPGRNTFVNFDKGRARRLVKPGQVFNRIHVDDIAGALCAALDRPPVTRIYNVTDDEPAPPQDVVTYAANLLNVPAPAEQDFETAELTPMARSFYGENKRVSNARVKEELGYAFRFPNYRIALETLHRDGWT